jgi:hypoxanthine phosphoribosyltransferase
MKFKNKIYLDYDDVESMNMNLVHDVSKFKPDVIVGITRGGLLPALHLSHHLDRPLQTIIWQTRDINKCEHDKKLQNLIDTGSRVVFVDDINDTGRTFSEISKAYHGARSNVMFISLVQKLETTHPATAALTLSDDRWIVFPWEKD